MKVTLTVDNTNIGISKELILFGARENYLRPNWGNNRCINIIKVEFDEYYKREIGINTGIEETEEVFYTVLLMDCVKYNFEVVSVNGKVPVFKIKNSDKTLTRPINPYLETYKMDVPSGENKIVIELKKLD